MHAEAPRFRMRPDASSWHAWDEAVLSGRSAHDMLPFLADEDIIELLATGAPEPRSYELRLLATELANRLVRFRRLVDAASAEAHDGLQEASRSAQRADDRTEETAQSIEHHIQVRKDAVEDEPGSARKAHTAARETREAVDDLRHAEDKLTHARREIGRSAREPPG